MRILAIDKDVSALKELTQGILALCPDAQLSTFCQAGEALAHLGSQPWDVAFLEIALQDPDSLALARQLKALNPRCNLIYLTGCAQCPAELLSLHPSGCISKPLTAEALEAELGDLRYPVAGFSRVLLRLNCFGNFEVYTPDGTPVRFKRAKAKELLAYLTYRKGSSCATRELAAALFEDNAYSTQQMTYLQTIISSMIKTLKDYGAGAAIHKAYNSISLNEALVDCDYYRFLQMDPAAINTYSGEFMAQYSWAEFIAGYLDRKVTGSPSIDS